jgi:glycosyltransferase involved in cell wall biosynthesis
MMTKEINLHAPLNKLGFGIFSFSYFKALKRQGYKVNWELIGSFDSDVATDICNDFNYDFKILEQSVNTPLNDSVPTITIWHPSDLSRGTKGTLQIGITHFETDKFTDAEVVSMKKCDIVTACSGWGKTILQKYNINTAIVPGICAPMYMPPLDPPDWISRLKAHLDPGGTATFISSVGKWEDRKDQEKFLNCIDAMNLAQKVIIFGSWYNTFTNGLVNPFKYLNKNGWNNTETLSCDDIQVHRWNTHPDLECILFPFLPSQSDLLSLIASTDIFVSSSRGEGWNQPLVEAMYLKKICVIPNNTAHMEYADSINSFLVKTEKATAVDGIWFDGSRGSWYPVDPQYLRENINYAIHAAGTPYGENKGNQAKERIKAICSEENIVETIERIINEQSHSTV